MDVNDVLTNKTCGKRDPFKWTFNTSRLSIYFKADSAVHLTGFRAQFNVENIEQEGTVIKLLLQRILILGKILVSSSGGHECRPGDYSLVDCHR